MRILHLLCLSLLFLSCLPANTQTVFQLENTDKKLSLKSPLFRSSPSSVNPPRNEKCGFAYVMNQAVARGFRSDEFEAQLKALIQQRAAQRSAVTIYTVPVIFHIVHRGEAVGTYPNLSAALVAAQIDQLNKDYSNLSGSTYGVATDAGLRFCAAVVDPAGKPLAEPGIHRINAVDSTWSNTATMDRGTLVNYFDNTIKPRSIWDAFSFVNVWTANISTSNLLGYASFPGLSTLSGLQSTETDATAGSVIEAASVGQPHHARHRCALQFWPHPYA